MAFCYGSLGWLVTHATGNICNAGRIKSWESIFKMCWSRHCLSTTVNITKRESTRHRVPPNGSVNIITNKATLPPKKKEKLNLNSTKTLVYKFTEINRGRCFPQGHNQSNPYCENMGLPTLTQGKSWANQDKMVIPGISSSKKLQEKKRWRGNLYIKIFKTLSPNHNMWTLFWTN